MPIRFSDTDAMGHVNNARFLSYLEDSRLAMLARIHEEGVDLGMGGVIVARVECDYVRPIFLAPEPLDVYVWIERIGTKSFTFGHRIEQHGEALCQGGLAGATGGEIQQPDHESAGAGLRQGPVDGLPGTPIFSAREQSLPIGEMAQGLRLAPQTGDDMVVVDDLRAPGAEGTHAR